MRVMTSAASQFDLTMAAVLPIVIFIQVASATSFGFSLDRESDDRMLSLAFEFVKQARFYVSDSVKSITYGAQIIGFRGSFATSPVWVYVIQQGQ